MPRTSFFGFDIFNEIEVNGQPTGDQEEPADYTYQDDGNGVPNDQPPPEPDNQGGDTQQPPTEENQPPEPGDGGGEEPPTDYTDAANDDPYQDGGDTGGGSAPPPQEESPVDDLKQQEEELYSQLTPEQLDIKHKELKSQFLNMYDTVVSIVERIGDINAAEENLGIIEYVSNTLGSLKDMLSDYVNDVYKTKSYIENSINYNRFLAVLNGINKILEEMNSKNDEK